MSLAHPVWAPERQKKIRKKYGYLVQSEHRDLYSMIEAYTPQVLEKITEIVSVARAQNGPQSTDVGLGLMDGLERTNGSGGSLSSGNQSGGVMVSDTDKMDQGLQQNSVVASTNLPPMGTFAVTKPLRDSYHASS